MKDGQNQITWGTGVHWLEAKGGECVSGRRKEEFDDGSPAQQFAKEPLK